MKKNLLYTLWLTAFLVAITVPLTTKAQCMCGPGVPATAIKHTVVLDTTNIPTSVITFPKFPPSIGTLTCVTFEDTLTLLTTLYGINDALVPVEYTWQLNVFTKLAGPGITVNQHEQRVYGPDLLAAYGAPGYDIYYGPDTLVKNSIHKTNASNVTPYLGTGDTTFVFTVNGGGFPTDGGTDYTAQMSSKYWGSFGLTYYWCPNIVMSTNIKNFAAVKSNKNINLSWIVGNDLISNTYEVQVSKNSHEFYGIGTTKANVASSGASAKYAYQYNPDKVVTGQLYFRIKQTDASGKISYSAIKTLNMDKPGASAFSAYPNPASNKVSLQFDANLNGDYKIDVTNQVGQIVVSRPLKLQNTSLIQLNLGSVKAPGMYYVRVKDAATGQIFTNKIMVNN